MSDTPKLRVVRFDDAYPTFPKPSVAEVVAWLQAQGAGEEVVTSIINVSDVPIRVITLGGPSGRYYVIPLEETAK